MSSGSQTNPLSSYSASAGQFIDADSPIYVSVGGSVNITKGEYGDIPYIVVISVTDDYGLTVSSNDLTGTISKAGEITVTTRGVGIGDVTGTIYAVSNDCTIQFNRGTHGSITYGGSTSQSMTVPKGTVCTINGASLTVTGYGTVTGSGQSGYEAYGWSYTGGSGVITSGSFSVTQSPTSISLATRSITEYTYSITYDANGGSGAPSAQSYGPTTDNSHTFTTRSTTPTKSGYVFLGWAKDLSAGWVVKENQSITLRSSEETSITLSAMWGKSYTLNVNNTSYGRWRTTNSTSGTIVTEIHYKEGTLSSTSNHITYRTGQANSSASYVYAVKNDGYGFSGITMMASSATATFTAPKTIYLAVTISDTNTNWYYNSSGKQIVTQVNAWEGSTISYQLDDSTAGGTWINISNSNDSTYNKRIYLDYDHDRFKVKNLKKGNVELTSSFTLTSDVTITATMANMYFYEVYYHNVDWGTASYQSQKTEDMSYTFTTMDPTGGPGAYRFKGWAEFDPSVTPHDYNGVKTSNATIPARSSLTVTSSKLERHLYPVYIWNVTFNTDPVKPNIYFSGWEQTKTVEIRYESQLKISGNHNETISIYYPNDSSGVSAVESQTFTVFWPRDYFNDPTWPTPSTAVSDLSNTETVTFTRKTATVTVAVYDGQTSRGSVKYNGGSTTTTITKTIGLGYVYKIGYLLGTPFVSLRDYDASEEETYEHRFSGVASTDWMFDKWYRIIGSSETTYEGDGVLGEGTLTENTTFKISFKRAEISLTLQSTDTSKGTVSQSSISVKTGTIYSLSENLNVGTITFKDPDDSSEYPINANPRTYYKYDHCERGTVTTTGGIINSNLDVPIFNFFFTSIPVTSVTIDPSTITMLRNRRTGIMTYVDPGSADPGMNWSMSDSIGTLNVSSDTRGATFISNPISGSDVEEIHITATSKVSSDKSATASVTVSNTKTLWTLKFDTRGGSRIQDMAEYSYGSYDSSDGSCSYLFYVFDKKPTRPGFRFIGWADTPTATEAKYPYYYTMVAAQSTVEDPRETRTIYAIWSDSYSIQLNANGGSIPSGETTAQAVLNEEDGKYYIVYLPIAYSKGMRFTGWFTEPAGGTEVTTATPLDEATISDPDRPYIIYAQYEAYGENEITLTIYRYIKRTVNRSTAKVLVERTFHLDQLQTIDDTTSAKLTTLSTWVYGAENRFVCDLGTSQKYNLKIFRITPSDPDMRDFSGNIWDEKWDGFDDRGLPNGIWMRLFRQAVDIWQNFNIDSMGNRMGGMTLRYIPADPSLYPIVEKNVFLAGTIAPQYGIQNMTFTLPLQVARMRTHAPKVDTCTLTFYYSNDNRDVFVTYTYPKDSTIPLPGAPKSWNSLSANSFYCWKMEGDSEDKDYMPGDPVTVSSNLSFYGKWRKIVCAVIAEWDEKPVILGDREGYIDDATSYDSSSNTTNLYLKKDVSITAYAVGGGGGCGGHWYSINDVGAPLWHFRHWNAGGAGGAGNTVSRQFEYEVEQELPIIIQPGKGGESKRHQAYPENGGNGDKTIILYKMPIFLSAEGGYGGIANKDSEYVRATRSFTSLGSSGGTRYIKGGNSSDIVREYTGPEDNPDISYLSYPVQHGGDGDSGVTNPGRGGTGGSSNSCHFRKMRSGTFNYDEYDWAFAGGGGGAASDLNISFVISQNDSPSEFIFRSKGGDGGSVNITPNTSDPQYSSDFTYRPTKTTDEMSGKYGGGAGSSPYAAYLSESQDPGKSGNGVAIILIYDKEDGQ